VPRIQPSRRQELAHVAREAQEPQRVGHGRAVLADATRHLLLREPELLVEALVGLRLLQRQQLLALDVLDQRQLQQPLVGHVAHHHRHGGEARFARGTPAALAGDDLVALALPAHQDRLHHARFLQGRRQLLQARRLEHGARLEGVGLQAVERGFGRGLGGEVRSLRIRQECGQSLAQRLSFHGP
jgi:hypothetical protein